MSKFKSKYQGHTKAPSVATTVINAEVNKFVENEKLNEENLKLLDERIRGAAKITPSAPPSQGVPDDAISVKSLASSKMSGASRISKAAKKREADVVS